MNVLHTPRSGPNRVPQRQPPRTPEEVARATELLLQEPTVAGRLRDAAPMAQERLYSGAAFLTGTWVDDDGAQASSAEGAPAIVKLWADPRQPFWSSQLARHAPDLVPACHATGLTLGGEPIPWIATERCPLKLDYSWGSALYTMLLDAGVRFQIASRQIGPAIGPESVLVDWYCSLVRRGLTSDPPAPGPAQEVADRLEQDWAWVLSTCRLELCHGDLHPANAVWRHAPPHPESRALLIDYAPHVLPWVSEPAYCQVVYWPAAPRREYPTFVHEMAAIRQSYGLEVPTPADVDRLAALFLGWHALRLWPGATHRHGLPDYVSSVTRWVEDCAAA